MCTFYALQTWRKHFYHYKQGQEILPFEKLFSINSISFLWLNYEVIQYKTESGIFISCVISVLPGYFQSLIVFSNYNTVDNFINFRSVSWYLWIGYVLIAPQTCVFINSQVWFSLRTVYNHFQCVLQRKFTQLMESFVFLFNILGVLLTPNHVLFFSHIQICS